MTSITTRVTSATGATVKGSPLSNAEVDQNFINLNSDKLEKNSNLSDLANAASARTNLGLGNVENKSSATIRGEISSSNVTTALGFTPENAANKGVANGYASLDAGGKVPSSQLPSYVDDVLEYAATASFPVTGSAAIIYVALDTNKTYRWSGSAYVEISPSEVTSVAGRTGAVTLTKTDVGLANVTNDAQLKIASNLSDLNNASTARTNLGLGSVATESTVPVAKGGTGSTTASGARTNLGLGTAATQNTTAFLQTANNLSDVTASTARTNLGLGSLATVSPTGTASSSTFLRGDGAWTTVSVTPTAVSDQANSSTGYFDLPAGTTAQRPGSPTSGAMRYNTSTGNVEFYNGTAWTAVGAATTELYASNGVVTHANTVASNYTVPANANVITVSPWTVANGVSFTLPSGSRQVLL